jgi:hypothetical protein
MQRKRINFNELHNEQFIRFYKFLFEEEFIKMSNDAKVLYCLIRDRMSLSIKNIKENNFYWLDKNGDVFIHFTKENIKEIMNCANTKAINLKKELINFGLIEDVRVGANKPNRIYILNVDYLETSERVWKSENQTSGSPKTRLPEVRKSDSNKTNINNTKLNKTTTTPSEHMFTNLKESHNTEKNFGGGDKKEFKQISKSELETLKIDIEEVVKDKVSINTLKNTIKKHDLEIYDMKYYLCNWDKFKFKTKDNPIGFFLSCVINKIPFPTKENGTYSQGDGNYIPQQHNFEQREYDDDYYESLYDNFKR